MNSTRNLVPAQLTTGRRRPTRAVEAVILVALVLAGAVSCTDGSVTEPLRPTSPVAGMKQQYDSVAPPEDKLAPPPSTSRAPAPLASVSASAASQSAASLTNVTPVAYAPEAGPFANLLSGCDDCLFGAATGFPIGFPFNFYGTTYEAFWISSNGFVAFQKPATNGCCHGKPLPLFDQVNNMIAVAWTDLNPKFGQMSFQTRGEEPRRRLIINFENVVAVGEGGKTITAQLILFEGTNAIEIHTASQPELTAHSVTQGAENAPATEAAFVNGRVASRPSYSLANDAVRFTGAPVNAIPVAIPGGNAGTAPNTFYQGVEGTAVEFKGSGTDLDIDDQLTYSWDFNNDGQPDATTAEASYTFADNGNYSAVLTVNDGRGGVGEAHVQVVIDNALPEVAAGNDVRIIAGESVELAGQFSDKGVRDGLWGWTYNLGSQGISVAAASEGDYGTTEQQGAILRSKRFCSAGSYPVKLTVVDKDGGSGSDDLVVTVDAAPISIQISPKRIALNDRGLMIVTAFSRPGLDATTLDASSIVLTNGKGKGTPIARTGGGLLHWNTTLDLNRDGLRDAVMLFRRDQLLANRDLEIATTKLMIKGRVGTCGEVLGSSDVTVRLRAKHSSAGSSLDDDSDSDSDG